MVSKLLIVMASCSMWSGVAQNPELKALLEKVTPAFQAHLDHPKELQTTLASAGAAK